MGRLRSDLLDRALAALTAAVFSAPCPGCGRGGEGGRLCDPCFAALPRLGEPRCATCGLPFVTGATGVATPGSRCGDCLDGRPYTRARALGALAGPLHDLVVALKYRGRRSLAFDLGERTARLLAAELGPADAVVPVPLGRRRRRERGYNQAEELARGAATALRLPLALGLLRRSRETAPQTELSRTARRDNVRGAFRARRVPARVLLIDDVYTTGATVEEAARTLRRAGAAEVSVLTLARTLRGNPLDAPGGGS